MHDEVYRPIVIPRAPRFVPKERAEQPWEGRIIALDTEGTADTGAFSATACWDAPGGVATDRFTLADDFGDFLIEQSQLPGKVLYYFHNLEWDLGVMVTWLRTFNTARLHYECHTARRNGSALHATFTYDSRSAHARKINLRDSYAIWPLSLEQLGKIVGLPKLKTPRKFLPRVVDHVSGEVIDNPESYDDAPLCDKHQLAECWQCYDLRDAEILHRAMRLYITECNDAGITPSLTRSAHAIKDFRTNYMDEPYWQYTERENLRALEARHGGRSEVHHLGVCIASDDEVIVQADVNSEYPHVMSQGGFPNAGNHRVLHRPGVAALDRYTGWAWAEVTIPELPIGPLLHYDERNQSISYPSGQTVQGCWTTDELQYAAGLGCDVRLAVLEGTPNMSTLDPFSRYIADKWETRARYKADGDPRSDSEKLNMNGLSGKFGMRWADPIVKFAAPTDPDPYQQLSDSWCQRADEYPHHYPDFIQVPWNALITARGRIMLHSFGMVLLSHGAELLACDTDSWTFKIRQSELAALPSLGEGLGEWKIEGPYHAFYGAAPKEYALYMTADELEAHHPAKYRAKGIGATPDRRAAVDHYLWDGDVWFQRPQKTRGVIRGGTQAVFLPVHKRRQARPWRPLPMLHMDWYPEVQRRRAAVADATLWERRNRDTIVTAVTQSLQPRPWR